MSTVAAKVGCFKRDVREVAKYRSQSGAEIADQLELVANDAGSLVGRAVAHRLRRCAEARNLWTAADLHTDDGELYEATGSLWSCGSRLCPSCCAQLARSSRRRARAAVLKLNSLLDHRTRWRWRWRSLVLTMPLMKGADITTAIARINDAFRRLTNRRFWRSRVVGGVKSVEFTVRPDGYHAHIHLLVLSDFIPINEENRQRFSGQAKVLDLSDGDLQSEFKHCLRAAGAQIDGDLVLAVYDVKRQGERSRGESRSLEAALQETCKYLTKTESWLTLPDSQLLAAAEVERWPRMFELLGRARERTNDGQQRASESDSSLLDRLSLSNGGERGDSWRLQLAQLDFDRWRVVQDGQIERAQRYRRSQLSIKFKFAVFRGLDGREWAAI